MKAEDISAISTFNDKKYQYLTITGKKNYEHIAVVKVGFLGRVFMKWGCHRAAMKNVINYLEKHAEKSLDTKLKQKLWAKIKSYSHKHKLPLSAKLKDIFNSDELKNEQWFKKEYNSTDKLSSMSKQDFSIAVKYMNAEHFRALDPTVAESLKFDLLKSLPEEVLEDYYSVYPEAVQKLGKGELNALIKKYPNLTAFRELSDPQIPLLDPKSLPDVTTKYVFGFDSPSPNARRKRRIPLLDPDQVRPLVSQLGTNHCAELTQRQIENLDLKDLDKDGFNKLFFGNEARIKWLKQQQLHNISTHLWSEHFAEMTETQCTDFDLTLLNEDQLEQYFTVHPQAIENVNIDVLHQLIVKYPKLRAFSNLTKDQIIHLDPSKIGFETFFTIFGQDATSSETEQKKRERIKDLSSSQVNGLLHHFGEKHCQELTLTQVHELDPEKVDIYIFRSIFTPADKIQTMLLDTQIGAFAKYMSIDHLLALSEKQLEHVGFETIRTLTQDQLEQFYKKYPNAIQNLNKEQINAILKKYPDSKIFKRISDIQIGYLDPTLMTVHTVTNVFGPDIQNGKRTPRIEFLDADQLILLFRHFGSNHYLAISESQIRDLKFKNIDKPTFLKIFETIARVNLLSEEQLFECAKHMQTKHLLFFSDQTIEKVSFRVIQTLTEQQVYNLHENHPLSIQKWNKDDLNTLIKKYPNSPIYKSISAEQIKTLDPKNMTTTTFATVFGYSAPGIKDVDRVTELLSDQLPDFFHFFGARHFEVLTTDQIQAVNADNISEKNFRKLFNTPERLQLITEPQMKVLKKYLVEEDQELLSDEQKAWL